MTRVAAAKPAHNKQILRFADEEGLQLLFCVIVPIMLGVQMADIHLYDAFINGKDSTPLLEILKANKYLSEKFRDYLFTQSELVDNRNLTTLEHKLQKMYEAIFLESARSDGNHAIIGKLSFTRQTKEKLMRAVSMLSQYASYE